MWKYDIGSEHIKRYIEAGLTPQQAEQLAQKTSNISSDRPPLNEYETALQRRVDNFHSASDKASSKSFMDSFRNSKPQMDTKEFFDKNSDYSTDPGAGKVSDKYIEAVNRQRIKDLLKRTGAHGLSPDEYQHRENMRSPVGSRARTTQEYINKLEAEYKAKLGKPSLVPDEGMANIKNLGANAALMGLGYLVSKTPDLQLDIKSAGEGADAIPPDYDNIMKELKIKQLMGR